MCLCGGVVVFFSGCVKKSSLVEIIYFGQHGRHGCDKIIFDDTFRTSRVDDATRFAVNNATPDYAGVREHSLERLVDFTAAHYDRVGGVLKVWRCIL